MQQLSDRLGVAQQENAQAGEKDSLISNLQSSLDMQIKQFAQLEQAIEVQKHVQQEQQKEVQQQLANTLQKHQLDFTQLIDAVQNRSPVIDVEPQITKDPEPKAQKQELQPENIAEQQIVEFNAVEQVSPDKVDSEQESPEILETVSELENILEQIEKDEPSDTDSIAPLVKAEAEIEPVSEADTLVQDLLNIAEPSFSTVTENETQHTETNVPEEAKSRLNVAGKFKGLLGRVKKSDTKSKPDASTETITDEALQPPQRVSDKFKGLLGKAKKSKVETEIEPQQKIETFTAEDLNAPESEQQIESFKSEDFKEPEAEDVHVDPDYGSSNFKVPGVLKKLFGKAKK